jgi:hypothetical protein
VWQTTVINFLEMFRAVNYSRISKCQGVRWAGEMEYVAIRHVNDLGWGCGRTLGASVDAYPVSIVERDRGSPGDSGNRVYL